MITSLLIIVYVESLITLKLRRVLRVILLRGTSGRNLYLSTHLLQLT